LHRQPRAAKHRLAAEDAGIAHHESARSGLDAVGRRHGANLVAENQSGKHDGADVNRLAEIAAKIFAELLHAENFTQRREDAKKFLTRISRISTNPIFQSP
jgi:hypothetical protein